MMKEQKRMAEQLTKLTNLFEGQSIILQEINSKLTVTEKHDSSLASPCHIDT